MTQRQFFFNVHIPKCGGTTFASILRRSFGKRYDEVYNLIWEEPYTAAQLAEFVDDSPGYDCMSSHRLSLDLPFEDARFRAIAIVFVRDPIDRFFSHYHYERNRDYERRRYANLKQLSPEQYVEYVLETEHEHFLLDYQFDFLMRNVPDASFDVVERLAATDRLLLLPLDRFDESLLVLQRLFPTQFNDVRYLPRNVSQRKEPVPAAAGDKVRPRMQRDEQLVWKAHTDLEARLRMLYPGSGELAAALAGLRRANRRKLWGRRLRKLLGRS